jgi:hypothetical protein
VSYIGHIGVSNFGLCSILFSMYVVVFVHCVLVLTFVFVGVVLGLCMVLVFLSVQ